MSESESVRDWSPGFGISIVWNILGTLITILGTLTFLEIHRAARLATTDQTLNGREFILAAAVTAVLVLALVAIHELLHGLAMRLFGARPSYGVGATARVFPYFYCTAFGHRFTKSEFSVVALAPAVLITAIGTLVVAFAPHGGWFVVPLGIHLGGCIGDIWLLSLALQQPPGTAIEDLKTGVRFHRAQP